VACQGFNKINLKRERPLPLLPQPYRRWLKAAQLVLVLAVLYFCADFALNRFAFNNGWTILWPLNGVTIALLLTRKPRDWPIMLLGVAIGTGVGEYFNDNAVWFEVGQRLISLTEVFLSAWLLPPFATFEEWLRRRLIFYRFLAALIVGPGISGLLAALLFHRVQGLPYLLAFNDWATADALGIAATMPLILSLGSQEMWRLFRKDQLPKTIAILVLALVCGVIIFSAARYPLLFLLFPLLLLVESLLGFAGSAVAVFSICLIAVYCTIHGYGPFGVWPASLPLPRDAALQIYLGFNLVALFPACILTMERRRMSAELVHTNEQLKMLASVDSITGIANRRTLDETFLKEWHRAIRLQLPLSLLMIDIDRFKQFNDLYGHHAGDMCLRQVADVLREHLHRAQDLAARFGGEEFALLLPHTSLHDARTLAENLREAVQRQAIHHEGSEFACITISIGCAALTPRPGDDHIQLLRAADAALYAAKQTGRNRVQAGTPAEPAANTATSSTKGQLAAF
jgi:diguanylate cyclase (GGDEF)-like protein